MKPEETFTVVIQEDESGSGMSSAESGTPRLSQLFVAPTS